MQFLLEQLQVHVRGLVQGSHGSARRVSRRRLRGRLLCALVCQVGCLLRLGDLLFLVLELLFGVIEVVAFEEVLDRISPEQVLLAVDVELLCFVHRSFEVGVLLIEVIGRKVWNEGRLHLLREQSLPVEALHPRMLHDLLRAVEA